MSERRQPGPLAILIGVHGLLLLTAAVFVLVMLITLWLLRAMGLEGRDAQRVPAAIGGLAMIPLVFVWKKFITWCGIVLPGKDTKH